MSAYHATHQLARSACLKCLPNGCHICCEGVITQYISLPVAFTFSCCSIGVYYSALFAMEKGCAALSNRVSDDSGSYTVNLTSHSHSVVSHLTPIKLDN